MFLGPDLVESRRIVHATTLHDLCDRKRVPDVGTRITIEHEKICNLADLEAAKVRLASNCLR
jgi:hypothetical protein